ncbi:hypothetical protein H3Z85_12440 [Chryseobacterium indologenes]|uniref:hypothetical protein n=1 Tax=Chryseobacterium indologenes TaxID=253 RepID=UPI0003E0693C|nr:hypothetical protein [Chryseobacterium indologenes]QPQ50321.1 hypothetical protein H3Z85_12440 [Chryseobacterium indologenes]GAE66430.1 hypothetical protein CIN01S_16_00110 [Chryseobacterium indologenes NBRC 14944]SFK45341.1 hypothetical protein SAMN05421692_4412 [Chryseobacterium indologenes]SUX52942.1 Uncharacterised protein [Chryseobacterium indologenes]
MKYSQLTVFNYKIAYYAMRIVGLYWLLSQYYRFSELQGRPKEIYEPFFLVEKIIFPEFPDILLFGVLLISCSLFIIISIFKPSYILNILIFLLMAVINLPLSANFGLHHDNHLVILGFFLSIFLLPTYLKENDYKLIQYFYLGLLMTYTYAGASKFLGTAKNIIKGTDKMLWINKNSAKLNSYDNYWVADLDIPVWMKEVYAYENLWVFLTMTGISLQLLCFLGAFNRKLLTFFMLFIVVFHLYNIVFVLADFRNAIFFVLAALFPYHLLIPLFRRNRNQKMNH